MIFLCQSSRQIHTITRTSNRIDPHNLDVISVLVGCLLGNAYAVKIKKIFQVQNLDLNKVVDIKPICFCFFLYEFFDNRGYCTHSGPREYKTILIKAANKKPKLIMGMNSIFLHLVV